jgi:hypothetical protein
LVRSCERHHAGIRPAGHSCFNDRVASSSNDSRENRRRTDTEGRHSDYDGGTAFDVNSTDATPRTVNAAYPPISYGPVMLYENMGAAFPLPQYPITIGTWTARKKGTMVFKTGSVKLILTATKLTETVECTAKPAATLAKTTVS